MHRGAVWVLAAFVITFMALLHSSHAIPFYPSPYTNARHKDYMVEVEDPDAVLDMLAKLGQSILRAQHEGSNMKSVTVVYSSERNEREPDVYSSNEIFHVINLPEATGESAKRGLDLGLARGFSGSQAAKHLMGLAAANFAAGPGKKKRGSEMMMSPARGDLTFGLSPAAAQDYLPVSPPASSNEWAMGNKE